jgi:hypothetical protein
MRWWPHLLEQTFPNTFDICGNSPPTTPNLFFSTSTCEASFVELYIYPSLMYAILWAAPYYIFFFIVGKRALRRGGYFTMFDDMSQKPAIAKALSFGGDWGKEFKYMCCHGSLCYLAFFMGPLLWHSFILHSFYLAVIVSVAVYNGGTFYFRVFAKRYYNTLIVEAQAGEESSERDHFAAVVVAPAASSGVSDGDDSGDDDRLVANLSSVVPMKIRSQEKEYKGDRGDDEVADGML